MSRSNNDTIPTAPFHKSLWDTDKDLNQVVLDAKEQSTRLTGPTHQREPTACLTNEVKVCVAHFLTTSTIV